MRLTRFIAILLLLGAGTAQAAESEDWSTFGRVLSLMQGFIQIAAQSQGDPKRVDRHVEGLLSGSNANANKLAEEVFADMPGEQRGQVLDLARQIVVLEQQQAAIERRQTGDSVAVQARKDLAGMGLSYFDRRQFLDAVKRNDMLAVRLYLAGLGVDTRGALEAAKRAGLGEMERLLAEAIPNFSTRQ